ncbi:MAG: nuclear transport factor 2 family protein [Eubacteriales bacterium]|nr:nuclear transport factor 2 family protein [Eubacteriales bacterium]
MDIQAFWAAVLGQDADRIRPFFHPEATVNWHCTNEQFTVEEYIRANCEYPGQWDGRMERVEQLGDVTVTAVKVFEAGGQSFHVVSFLRLAEGKIAQLDEYWGDDGPAPQWRRDKKIGKNIR